MCVWFLVQCDKLYIGRFDWHVEWYAFIWQIWTVVHCHDSWIKMFALNIFHCQTFMHGILVVVGFSLSTHKKKGKWLQSFSTRIARIWFQNEIEQRNQWNNWYFRSWVLIRWITLKYQCPEFTVVCTNWQWVCICFVDSFRLDLILIWFDSIQFDTLVAFQQFSIKFNRVIFVSHK